MNLELQIFVENYKLTVPSNKYRRLMTVGDERRVVLKQPGRVWYQITAKNKSSAIILLFFTFGNALRETVFETHTNHF